MAGASLSEIDPSRLRRMIEVSRELNSTTDLDDLLKLILTEAASLTDAEAASIMLLDAHTRELHFKATSHEMYPEMVDLPVPLEGSIAGTVLTTNAPLIVDDVSQDARWNPQVSQAINFPTGSILGVPMSDVDRPVGVLEALNKREGPFTQQDVSTLSILADLAGVALEKARLIGELRSANQQLSELDRLKSDFIAVASHELRSPLSIILGYVAFLREEAEAEVATQLDKVLGAAVQLRGLIQDMLNLQYVDTGRSDPHLAPVDLTSLVREMVAERDETALAKEQGVSVTLPEAALPILADKNMIQLVLSNLLDNAIKFTPAGGQIDITLEQHGGEAWLTVADTGVGIAEDQSERIFQRFYQVEPHLRRQFGGMGLGLAIARELVELNRGRIWASSRPGQGSHFYVALPLNDQEG